jgi:hypothetical protein
MNKPITRRQVTAILARHGYQDDTNPSEPGGFTTMLKTLGPKPDDWIMATVDGESVSFSVLPMGKLHINSYDIPINPTPPRAEPGGLEKEMLDAEELVRQARWAIEAHIQPIIISQISKNDGGYRNGTTP